MGRDWPGIKFPKGGQASMTGAEWLAQSKSKRNKFGAVSTNGFPSRLEAAVYAILELRQMAGEIRELKRYPSVRLTKRISWKLDYEFVLVATGARTFAEAKGVLTDECALKLKLWRDAAPGNLEWWKGSHSSPFLAEIIVPERIVSEESK